MPAYEADLAKFKGLNAQVLGISIDHIPCLEAWANHLGGISYPLLSDFWPHGGVAEKYGVLRRDGVTERAIFIIDREGVVRYIDIHDKDQQPNNGEILAILRQIDPQAAAQNPATSVVEDEPLPSGGIIMYCTSWCIDCKKARDWLDQFNLPYREVDINQNPTAAAQVRKWTNGYETTPTFDIDGTIVVDFDVERLNQVLKDRLK